MNLTVERRFHLVDQPGKRSGRRRQVLPGAEPTPPPEPTTTRIHPLARRMALAITCKRLIDSGVVADAAEMSRVAGITRARMTQILNLTLLAPDLQERLLFLCHGDCVDGRRMQVVCRIRDWTGQRLAFATT